MHEKRDYEDKYLQVSLALEKKAKDLSTSREKCSQLEAAMAQLEALSQQQLQRVATHSEAAVDAAQAQMSATHGTLTGYQQFVKVRGCCVQKEDVIVRKKLVRVCGKCTGVVLMFDDDIMYVFWINFVFGSWYRVLVALN